MRFHDPLTHILDNKTKVVCLRLLCKYPTQISGRQLSKIIKINPTTVNEAVNSLVANQIVMVRKAGKAHLYELNKNHWVVAKILRPMFKLEDGLLNDFIDHIVRKIKSSQIKKEIVSIALYGSVQEKNEKPASDIDLFVVLTEAKYKKKVEDLIFEINSDVLTQVGMGIEPNIKSVGEFKKNKKLNVFKSILKSHRIILGQKLEKLL